MIEFRAKIDEYINGKKNSYSDTFKLPAILTRGIIIAKKGIYPHESERFPIARCLLYELNTQVGNFCIEQIIVREEDDHSIRRFILRGHLNNPSPSEKRILEENPIINRFSYECTLIRKGIEDTIIHICAIPASSDYVYIDNIIYEIGTIILSDGKINLYATWEFPSIDDFYTNYYLGV
jgi:hypothetical protein